MQKDHDRRGHRGLKPNFVHVSVGSLLAISVILFNFRLIKSFDLTALFSIAFFNILFLFLIFPLEGSLRRKLVLLMAGNQVGVLWYGLQLLFEESILTMNAEIVKIIVLVVTPLFDFVWIVSIWSISLSMMASHKTKMEKLEKS